MSFTNQSKNTTSYTNQSKNSTSFLNPLNLGKINYLTTDTPDYVLVGSAEDEVLILWGDTSWGNQSKS